MQNTIAKVEKPDTIRANQIKEWIRIHLLTPYLWKIPRHEKTLDLACGWGFSFKINPNFFGIEYDPYCYEYLKAQNRNVIRGSLLEPLAYEPNFFDNCFSHDVLEHFELSESEIIIKNVHRILKSGGKMIHIIPNKKGYDFGLKINAGHKHYITPAEVREIAERNGFKYISTKSSPFPEFFHIFFTHNKWVVTFEKV